MPTCSQIIFAAAAFGGAIAVPDVAAAEVMDKEPTLLATWMWAVVGGVVGLLGWHFRWWVGAALALVPGSYFVALHLEISDPYVGPAIVQEAGQGYVVWSYGAAAVFLVLQATGLWHAARGRAWRPS